MHGSFVEGLLWKSMAWSKVATRLRSNVRWCTSEAGKYKKRNRNGCRDDLLLKCNTGWKKHTADRARASYHRIFHKYMYRKVQPKCQKWPESHFQTPTPLLFQNFWIRIRLRKFFKSKNPIPVQTRFTIDATEIPQCFYLRNDIYKDPADSCCRKWQATPDPAFH